MEHGYTDMLTLEQFFGFLLAAALITASPGPDNMMVLGMGVSKGRKHGIAFGLGCAIGCLSHTALAVAGVSALIAASPIAFTLLRIGGGLYLVWLGVKALRSRSGAVVGQTNVAESSVGILFIKGMLANAMNPKVILFFLSFLPQFVAPAQGNVGLQMASLGIVFTAQAFIMFGLLGYFAGSVGQGLSGSPRIGIWLDRLAGAVFVGLGARLIAMR